MLVITIKPIRNIGHIKEFYVPTELEKESLPGEYLAKKTIEKAIENAKPDEF